MRCKKIKIRRIWPRLQPKKPGSVSATLPKNIIVISCKIISVKVIVADPNLNFEPDPNLAQFRLIKNRNFAKYFSLFIRHYCTYLDLQGRLLSQTPFPIRIVKSQVFRFPGKKYRIRKYYTDHSDPDPPHQTSLKLIRLQLHPVISTGTCLSNNFGSVMFI